MNRNRNPHKEFEKTFSKNHAGYVLITCENPSDDGNMHVEMTYGGSPALVNILIHGAQVHLEEQPNEDIEEETIPNISLVKP
ncbi:Uncharacterized protein PHSC3_001443 [Chlamydiales bacterium STE3]|nr:Uncharacterized protein PHSC3_001443 [Chlamydiales bacterium STE3]